MGGLVSSSCDKLAKEIPGCLQSNWDHDHTIVGDAVLVSDDGAPFRRFSSSTSSKGFDTTIQQRIASSLVSENETPGSSFIRKAFRHTELPIEVTKVILESW